MSIDSIISTVKTVRTSEISNVLVHENLEVSGSNEFLFFIKPELLIEDPKLNTRQVIEMILDKIDAFDLNIKNARVLSAGYLAKHGIIAQHYGVINQIASNAKASVSEGAKEKFESIFAEKFETAPVLGGLEMIEKFPEFTAAGLDYLWQNVKFEKLAGGTYANKVSLDGQPYYLVNGFHARQLEHFTQKGRCIVVLTLTGDIGWESARGDFIGATCPDQAHEGSIRRTLLDHVDVFGLQAVTPSWNGVHLSAGPVEGLIELIRYQSDLENGDKLKAADFAFGRQLIEVFGKEKTEWILTNPNVETDNGPISVFDFTEEKNASEALELLKSVISVA